MASPEPSGRPVAAAAPRAATNGVRNLLAMFEKGTSAPSSPGALPVTREVSPGPKPLGKVRTSFVAVAPKDGQAGFGMQKLPLSPSSPGGEINFGAPFGPALGAKLEGSTPKEPSEPIKKRQEEAIPVTTSKVEDRRKSVGKILPSSAQKADTAKATHPVEKPPASPENLPPGRTKPVREKVATKETHKKEEPHKKDGSHKEKPATTKPEPAPPAPHPAPQPASSKAQTRPTLASKALTAKASAAKNLTVPTTGPKTSSPLPSPRSPARPTHSRKPSASTTTAMDPPQKPKATPSTGAPAPRPTTKPRQPVFTHKPKPALAHKPVPKPDPKEATKPEELTGSAFAPTASWVAKMGGQPIETTTRRERPPSSTMRTSRSVERTLRRQKSTISDHSKENAKATARPATSAAHHSAPSSDFLSRMMRPTKSSAGKAHDKTETKLQARTGSAMGRQSDEPSSPPRIKKAGMSPKRISREIPTLKVDKQYESGSSEVASPTRKKILPISLPSRSDHSDPESIPEENEVAPNKALKQKALVKAPWVRPEPVQEPAKPSWIKLGKAPVQASVPVSAKPAPVKEAPVQETPVQEAPMQEAPVQEAPVQETPVPTPEEPEQAQEIANEPEVEAETALEQQPAPAEDSEPEQFTTPQRTTPELTVSTDSGEHATAPPTEDDGDGGHTPTTTSSSATLVHDGDSPDTTKEG